MITKYVIESVSAFVMIALLVIVGGLLMWPTGEVSMPEIAQLILLGISMSLWMRRSNLRSPSGIICTFMMCIAIACIGRESSWGSAYHMTDRVSDRIELGAIVILSFVGVCILVAALKHIKPLIALLQHRDAHHTIAYLAISLGCLLLGDVFDHKFVSIYASPLIEESCEVIAYAYFCRAAYIFSSKLPFVSTA